MGNWDSHGSGAGALPYDPVDLEILHCDVEHLLKSGLEAVDLIDEENGVLGYVGQDSGKVLWLVQSRGAGHADFGTHLIGHDCSQSGLSESRRTDEKHVVERLAPVAGCLDEDTEVILDLLLPLEVLEILGSQDVLLGIGLLSGSGHD